MAVVGGVGVTGSILLSLARYHASSPNISLFFRSQSHFSTFRYFMRYHPHVYTAVTSDSDLTQPDFDNTGGGSDRNGSGSGGGGGGKSGDNNQGDQGSDSD